MKKPEKLKIMEQELKETMVVKEESTTTTQHDIFTIVENDKETFITIANVIISTKRFKDTEEAIKYIDSKPYELIINVCCFAFEINTKKDEHETK